MKIYYIMLLLLAGCASTGSQLKYNIYEDQWTYERPGSKLKFNYLEKKWEWAE